jgi:hypothetical protein
VGRFVRRVPTASGATAVQIVHKRGRDVVGIDHIGSAHDEAELELLLHVARERLHAGQQTLDLELPAPQTAHATENATVAGQPLVEATGSLILWNALATVYDALGFSVVRAEAFKALVLGRIVEPTSKVDTIRVLTDVGVPAPSRATFQRCLGRVVERDYRNTISHACYTHATRTGGLALVLYDLTTLYFEAPREDGLRKVGMSKERRVDPQVTVGLLTDKTGFPLSVHLFEGNKAETKTVVPVLTEFKQRHPDAGDVVVVADAGMLSAANLLALQDAGFSFIVGSRSSKAPYDLADHLERHGNAFDDGQTIEATRTMGTGKNKRVRRVVWQWSRKRYRHDIQAINAMVDRAEAVAEGTRALKKDRFVKISDADPHRRLGPRQTRPTPGRTQGLRHQPARRRPGRTGGGGRLPRPLPGRTLLQNDQDRPGRPPGLPPTARQHRGPPHRRVRRARRLPRGTSPHRPIHQQDPQDPQTAAHRHDHHRPSAGNRRTKDPSSSPTDSGRPRPTWLLKLKQLRPELKTLPPAGSLEQ